MRVIFLSDGNLLTTGFSRMSERQLALWNPVSCCTALTSFGDPELTVTARVRDLQTAPELTPSVFCVLAAKHGGAHVPAGH